MLFPELDRALVERCLRDGMRVDSANTPAADVARALETISIIRLSTRRFVRCAYEEDDDYLERCDPECHGVIELGAPDDIPMCPECGQPVEDIARKTVFQDLQARLDRSGIEVYLTAALGAAAGVASAHHEGDGAISASLSDGARITVVVLDFAGARHLYAGLYFAEPTLYVVASPIHRQVLHVLEQGICVELADILSRPQAWLEDTLSVARHSLAGPPQLPDLEAAFDKACAHPDGWKHFEQSIMPGLYTHITEHPEHLQTYLGTLRRYSGTILNYFMVPVGGSEKTDLRQIDKFELMNELFAGDWISDAKMLDRSPLDLDAFDRVVRQFVTDPTNPRRAIIFLATDDVRPSVWQAVMDLNRNDRFGRVILLTRYMVLELFSALQATELLT